MATPNKFKFYIYRVISGVATYYYINNIGVISTTIVKEGSELEFAPTNWNDIEKRWVRSESMHGIMNKLSNEYTFWGDGGKILKHLIFTYGYDVKAKLLVEIRKDSDWTYEFYSDNDIKMSKPTTDIDGVSVELFDSGMASDFMANLDTPYEIPLTGSDVVTVEHEGTEVKARYNYRFGASFIEADFLSEIAPGTGIPNGDYVSFLSVVMPSEGIRPIAEETGTNTLRMGTQSSGQFFMNMAGDQSDQYENKMLTSYQTIYDIFFSVKCDIKWQFVSRTTLLSPITFNAFLICDLIISKPLETFRIKQRLYTGTLKSVSAAAALPPVFGTINEDAFEVNDFSIGEMYDGECAYLVFSVMTGTSLFEPTWSWLVATQNTNDSRISMSFKFESTPTDVPAFRLHTLAQKTVEAFADGKYGILPFSSNLLSSPISWVKGTYPFRTVITNGNALKGITDSIFKVSMKDLIQDVQANYPCGVGVEGNTLKIEQLNYFYDDSITIYDFGELTDVKITPINAVPTLLVFGNKFNNDNDVLNGSLDYNTQTTFKSPNITDLKSKKEYVSPIVSCIYNIEKIRVSEYGKDTTGIKVNEDLYKLGIVDEPTGGKYKISYQGTTGLGLYVAINTLNNPYNVDFSPKNMWLRNKEVINSNAYPSTSEITYQKTERYSGMGSVYYDIETASYSPLMAENTGFSPDGMDMLWLPFKITCNVILPKNLDALLSATPYGKFKGTYNGVEIHFFLDEAVQKVSNGNSFQMEGRLTPSTNIAELIF